MTTAQMTSWGSPCGEVCKHPLPSCYCDLMLEFQDQLAGRSRGFDPVLWREVSCVQGWSRVGAWITRAYTNRHGSGAAGTCERGHNHLWSLTEKEYRAVNEALQQPKLPLR